MSVYNHRGLIVIGKGGQAEATKDVINRITSYSISQRGRLSIDKYVDFDNLDVEVGRNYLIAFGSLKNIRKRKEVFEIILAGGGNPVTLISPTAVVSQDCVIGDGSVVMNLAFVNTGAKIGANCLLNTGCIIEHDCYIGAHSLILTNATVNGNCEIGTLCMIGSGAVVLHGIKICSGTTVGAGAVVCKNITEAGIYVGTPAVRLERR